MSTLNEKSKTFRRFKVEPEKFCTDIVETMKSGVYRADREGNLSYANQAFAEILKYDTREEIVGLNMAKEFYKRREDRITFLKALQEKGYVCDYQIRMVRKDGSVAVVSVRSNIVRNKEGEVVGVEGVLNDVTERKENSEVSADELAEGKLKSLTEDSLTGLPNYQVFARSLDYEAMRATRYLRPLCVLMMDVDDLAAYNDELGREQGDMLLRQIGKITRENLRDTDILCRHSQDAFVVILPETGKDEAMAIAAKIKKAVEGFAFKKTATVSIGAARHIPGMTWNELFLKANTGLCMAKEVGKNDVCLYG